jgi:hypothetical protein
MAERQQQPCGAHVAPLERVLDGVAAPRAVEHRRRVEPHGVRAIGQRGEHRGAGGRHDDRARVVPLERGPRRAARRHDLHEVDRRLEPPEPAGGPDPGARHRDGRAGPAQHLGERGIGDAQAARGAQRQQHDVRPPAHPPQARRYAATSASPLRVQLKQRATVSRA